VNDKEEEIKCVGTSEIAVLVVVGGRWSFFVLDGKQNEECVFGDL